MVDIGHTGNVIFTDYMEWVEVSNPTLLTKTTMKLMPSFMSLRGDKDNNIHREYDTLARDAKVSEWIAKRKKKKEDKERRRNDKVADREKRRSVGEIIYSSTNSSRWTSEEENDNNGLFDMFQKFYIGESVFRRRNDRSKYRKAMYREKERRRLRRQEEANIRRKKRSQKLIGVKVSRILI